MAKEGQSSLEAITGALAQAGTVKGPPPVERWNPPFCGDLDMRIAGDGTWFYLKTPIGRPALVELFASVLKREGDSYFLVTPVEKCGITVDDAALLDGRNQEITVALAFQHRCEQLYQCRPADRRFEIEPCTVAGDAHVEIAAKRRIPALDGRGPLDGAGLRQRACDRLKA